MKMHLNRVLRAVRFMALMSAASWAGAQTPSPPTRAEADAALYTLGLHIGEQLHQNGVTGDVSMSRVEQGIKDAMAGRKAVAADQMRLQAYLRSAAGAAAAKNAAAAHEFLARNANAAGVTTTASGLQYKVIETGNAAAASPGPTDLVTLNFRGRLLDGTEFDSSSTPGTASTVQANGVMKAWTEALSLMKPGAKWQLFVPPELGYGPNARLGVPGGSLLIYDVQLVSVAPPLVTADPFRPATR